MIFADSSSIKLGKNVPIKKLQFESIQSNIRTNLFFCSNGFSIIF